MHAVLGTTHVQFSYVAPSVHGTGQLGTVGFSVADAAPSVQGDSHLGTVGFIIDSNIPVAGLAATGLVGAVVVDSSTAYPQGVVGYGEVGAVTVDIISTPSKRIYTHVPPAI